MDHIKNAKLIVYDFDGVMTDNKVILREDGFESVVVNRSDGLAIGFIKKRGIPQLILSKEINKVVKSRAKKLGIPAMTGVDDKKGALEDYCKRNRIAMSDVAYIGNDVNDLEVMRVVGYPLCPSDAHKEIKKISDFVLDVPGGAGVVRALMDLL